MNTHHCTRRKQVFLLAVMLGVSGGGLSAATAFAEVPHLIRYQGQAVDSNSTPLEGPYNLTFRLYDAETAGTVVWEEVQPGVQLTEGRFGVLLGQVNPLKGVVDWTQPCWLSIQVNADPELSPRQQITSVPLAIMAEKLSVPVTTSTIEDDANSLMPAGAIVLWDGATCPAGYTRLSTLDGKFLVSGATFNAAAGGSNTHAHGPGSYTAPSHTHSMSGSHTHPYRADGGADPKTTSPSSPGTSTNAGGGGVISGSSASVDSRPAFATVLLCQKD